ncbi:elongation factor TU GTP binding domain-containing protein [Cryptosporidium felis]|nr:elongation factor TU GTP binding domain-containing protein [Cryptosporidium felis]
MARTRSKYVELTDDDYYDAYDSDYLSDEGDEQGDEHTMIETKNRSSLSPARNISSGVRPQLKNVKATNKVLPSIQIATAPDIDNYSCVVLGHVDSGKSTLMGQLFVSLGLVSEGVLRKYKKESESIGKGSFAYAWIFDDCDDERERGITINVSARTLKIEQKVITVLDAPGHSEFIPSAFSITMFSDNSILVIDSSSFESEFSRGQTTEHIIYSLIAGVSNLIVAVNKLDLCNWDEQTYHNIVKTVDNFINFELFDIKGDTNIIYIPISAFHGVNLLKRSSHDLPKEFSSWYTGPSLFELLSSLGLNEKRTRVRPATCLCHKESKQFTSFSGCILDLISISSSEFKVSMYLEYGTLKVGSSYLLLPSNEAIKCKSISIHDKTVNSCNGPIYICSATFNSNTSPNSGDLILSLTPSRSSTRRNSNNLFTILPSIYPILLSTRLKVKCIKLFTPPFPDSKNTIWNVPGKSLMLHHHCESFPATLINVKDNFYYFETEKGIISYNKCRCNDFTNLSRVLVRYFSTTVFVGEFIFH